MLKTWTQVTFKGVGLLLLGLCLSPYAAAEAPIPVPPPAARVSAEPPPSGASLRLSALIQFDGGLKAGIVDTSNQRTFYIGIGERIRGVELVTADFDRETIWLIQDDVTWALSLEDDPNAYVAPPIENPPPPHEGPYRGEGIEEFLREHPEAVIKGNLPALSAPSPDSKPAEGLGEGIEAFLKADPALANKARTPAVGRGETIERMLRENPELAAQVNQPVQGKGEGIEKFLRENPNPGFQPGTGPIPSDPETGFPIAEPPPSSY